MNPLMKKFTWVFVYILIKRCSLLKFMHAKLSFKKKKQITKQMRCKRCGYCCTLIAKITFLEMLRIMLRGYLNFAEKDPKGRRCIKLISKDCYFLVRKDRTTRCRIYNIRPQVCRDFPSKEAEECRVDKRSFKERILGS